MLTFQELLKEIRNESGLTQEEFARVLGVSTILITLLETGKKEVSKKFIENLSDKLDVHPSSVAPLIFLDDENLKVSSFENKIIDFGEKIQKYLIKTKAKRLRQYV